MEINLVYNENRNITIAKNEINSIILIDENHKNSVLNSICEFKAEESDFTVDNQSEKHFKKYVFWLKENYNNMLFNINIKEDIKFYLGTYNEEKLEELLKEFELNINILDRPYIELSSSEVRKILIIIGMLSATKILIIENPTIKLDIKSIQTLIKFLKRQKREKTIILTSYNSNFLLEVSDNIMVFSGDKLIKSGKKFDMLSDEKFLSKINMDIPNVINMINKVKKQKNIKLCYRDNVNDLIKDMYRYAK